MKLLNKVKDFFELLYLIKTIIIIILSVVLMFIDVIYRPEFPLFLVSLIVFGIGLYFFRMETGCRAP